MMRHFFLVDVPLACDRLDLALKLTRTSLAEGAHAGSRVWGGWLILALSRSVEVPFMEGPAPFPPEQGQRSLEGHIGA